MILTVARTPARAAGQTVNAITVTPVTTSPARTDTLRLVALSDWAGTSASMISVGERKEM